jgi:hypothetical protein
VLTWQTTMVYCVCAEVAIDAHMEAALCRIASQAFYSGLPLHEQEVRTVAFAHVTKVIAPTLTASTTFPTKSTACMHAYRVLLEALSMSYTVIQRAENR